MDSVSDLPVSVEIFLCPHPSLIYLTTCVCRNIPLVLSMPNILIIINVMPVYLSFFSYSAPLLEFTNSLEAVMEDRMSLCPSPLIQSQASLPLQATVFLLSASLHV